MGAHVDDEVEQMIEQAGLTAPRVTPGHIDTLMREARAQYHVFPGTTLTVCCLTLPNGYVLVGTSAAASPENFNREIGEKIAFQEARDQAWHLEGYLLKQRLFEEQDKPGL